MKTKPSQHSVQVLREIGISPDIIICRCEFSLSDEVKDKISLFCNVNRRAVIEEVDVKHSIYEVPLQLHEEGIDTMICELFKLPNPPIDLKRMGENCRDDQQSQRTITVGIVGKYVQHQDAYKSVFEALAPWRFSCRISIAYQTF